QDLHSFPTRRSSDLLAQNNDFLLWYAKDSQKTKFRQIMRPKVAGQEGGTGYKFVQTTALAEEAYTGKCDPQSRLFMKGDATSQRDRKSTRLNSSHEW